MTTLRVAVLLGGAMSVIAGSTQAAWAWSPPPASATTAPAGQPAPVATAPVPPASVPGAVPPPNAPPTTGYPPPAGYPPSYPPGAYPAPVPTAPPMRPGFTPVEGPTVRLVTDNSRAHLQRQFQLRWTDVCAAPCGIPVSPAGTYRVGGGSLRATDPFSMPRSSGTVLVQAKMGSNVKHWVGVALIIAGGVNLLGGGLYLVAAQNATGNIGTSDLSKKDYFTAWGVGGLILGAILTGISIPLLVGGSSSAEVR